MAGFAGRRRDRIALACALAVPVAVCAALVPFRTSVPNTDAALLLVAFVVAVAAFGNRVAGYLAALGAAAWFDFFLTAPYERFAITHRTDVETTVLLLAVGVAVTEIAVAARRHRARVVTDEALLAVVEFTSSLVARGEPADAVVDQVRVQLPALLGGDGCLFRPGPGSLRGLRLEPDGSVRWGAAVWNLDGHGFPKERLLIPARHSGVVYGLFALSPVPGTAPGPHARRVAVILADLAGAALAAGTRTGVRESTS